MSTTETNRDAEEAEKLARKGRHDRANAAAKAQGFPNLYALCRERKGEYQLVQRAIRFGLTKRTTQGTIAELERLGLLDAVKASSSAA